MPRNPPPRVTRLHQTTASAVSALLSPISVFSRSESPAFVRSALADAASKGWLPQPANEQHRFQRSRDTLAAIENEEHWKRAAEVASTHLLNARSLFEQGHAVNEFARPIIYYYGAVGFLEFATHCLIRRTKQGAPGHGLSLTCDSDGQDFGEDWPRKKCRVEMLRSGDFPFFVDALTVAGCPSLFSGFNLTIQKKGVKSQVTGVRENPHPLLRDKMSLDLLCNFDLDKYLSNNPGAEDWIKGVDKEDVWETTQLLLDVAVVFAASSLARYHIPAWRRIVEASQTPIYNDIRAAYRGVTEGIPYFLSRKTVFEYCFGTKIR